MITKRLDKSLSSLIKDADSVFSKYIRTKDSVNGICKCFICGARMPISIAQNMHYIDRDQMPTRYDEMNCHPGCQNCNCVDPEHGHNYAFQMVITYGLEAVKELEDRSRGLQKFMRHELLELIDTYKQKLKDLNKQTV